MADGHVTRDNCKVLSWVGYPRGLKLGIIGEHIQGRTS